MAVILISDEGTYKDQLAKVLVTYDGQPLIGPNGKSEYEKYCKNPYLAFIDFRTHHILLRYKYHDVLQYIKKTIPLEDCLKLSSGDVSTIFLTDIKLGDCVLVSVDPLTFLNKLNINSIPGSEYQAIMGLYIFHKLLDALPMANIYSYLPTLLRIVDVFAFSITPYVTSAEYLLSPHKINNLRDILDLPLAKGSGLGFLTAPNSYCLYCFSPLLSDGLFCSDSSHAINFCREGNYTASKRSTIYNFRANFEKLFFNIFGDGASESCYVEQGMPINKYSDEVLYSTHLELIDCSNKLILELVRMMKSNIGANPVESKTPTDFTREMKKFFLEAPQAVAGFLADKSNSFGYFMDDSWVLSFYDSFEDVRKSVMGVENSYSLTTYRLFRRELQQLILETFD